jgi:hypothetical protein
MPGSGEYQSETYCGLEVDGLDTSVLPSQAKSTLGAHLLRDLCLDSRTANVPGVYRNGAW